MSSYFTSMLHHQYTVKVRAGLVIWHTRHFPGGAMHFWANVIMIFIYIYLVALALKTWRMAQWFIFWTDTVRAQSNLLPFHPSIFSVSPTMKKISKVELVLNKSDSCGTNKQQWFHDNKATKTEFRELYPENKSICKIQDELIFDREELLI